MNQLTKISRDLARKVDGLKFGAPVAHVYNPLIYARQPHEKYLEKFGSGRPEAILVGMNPGPFGMAQTGIPFGDVTMAREFLGIEGAVGKPRAEHPKRRIDGFACSRGEVSGTRVWSWARDRFGSAKKFFERFFVVNYCPLVFLEGSGRNRTPDKLPHHERDALFPVCDDALRKTVRVLRSSTVIGIGVFAQARCRDAFEKADVCVGRILHPSPASPAANRGWAPQVDRQLQELGIL